MSENLGIRANLSQGRNHDLCEHDLWLLLSSFDSTQVSEVQKSPQVTVKTSPKFADKIYNDIKIKINSTSPKHYNK